MITIFLCCEGPSDDTVIKVLAERVLPHLVLSIKRLSRSELKEERDSSRKRFRMSKGKAEAPLSLSIRALAHRAKLEDSQIIAWHKDTDKRNFNDVYTELQTAFRNSGAEHFSFLPIVTQKMIECWLLADEHAYEKAYRKLPRKPSLPANPETIWGDEADAKSNHPKCYIERILRQFGRTSGTAEFSNIAEHTNIQVLLRRCPISFGRFHTDILQLEQWAQEEEITT